MELCKIRFDGHHNLACPLKNKREHISAEDIINSTTEELGVEKKKLFKNEWAEWYFPFPNKGRQKEKQHIKKLKLDLKQIYFDNVDNYKRDELIEFMFDIISSDYDYYEYYNLSVERNMLWLKKIIEKFYDREKENLKARKRLFKRKALSNEWNYFCTFTYDDKKHNEETFVKTLKKKLQNLHTNYGWLYMGCFERSSTNRLHFHGILYVPNGTMKSKIREEIYFDTKARKKAVSYINEDFEDKLGRNDFKPITKADLTFTHSLDYILKYIGKENQRIIYSRGIKDDIFALVDIEDNLICKVSDKSPYYVLADIPIIELTKDLNKLEIAD